MCHPNNYYVFKALSTDLKGFNWVRVTNILLPSYVLQLLMWDVLWCSQARWDMWCQLCCVICAQDWYAGRCPGGILTRHLKQTESFAVMLTLYHDSPK